MSLGVGPTLKLQRLFIKIGRSIIGAAMRLDPGDVRQRPCNIGMLLTQRVLTQIKRRIEILERALIVPNGQIDLADRFAQRRF